MGDSDEWALEVSELKVEIFHLKEIVTKLNDEKLSLEAKNDELNCDLTDAQEAADQAEEERDQRTEERDQAAEELRQVRRSMLEFLKDIEFINNADCPRCFFDWRRQGLKKQTHRVDCPLKLMIYQLDMDLNKPTYTMS